MRRRLREMMLGAGVPLVATRVFLAHYDQLHAGATGVLRETEIEPVRGLPECEAFGEAERQLGHRALAEAVVIKLNGGLGTSMGMEGPKSLLRVRGSRRFIDLIAEQALGAKVPLVLMNSFATDQQTREVLEAYPNVSRGLPGSFLQHRVPKVARDGLGPVEGVDDHYRWCPPGHGDLFAALHSRGVLDALLDAGRRWAFVSNADNLGAVLSPALLGAFVASGSPLWMEVTDRTSADRKGGHLARRGKQLVLRERAQCHPDDAQAFQNIRRHRFFNTNNLWIDLKSLRRRIDNEGPLVLPLIRNAKHAIPTDPASPPVYQLESAMGAAIAVLPGASAVRVTRQRFSPVKTTADLLAVRSDLYRTTDDHRVVLDAPTTPDIVLDPRYFATVPDLDARIPVTPSLRAATGLAIVGDVRFEGAATISGNVRITAAEGERVLIPDGAVLKG